jgi:hypothetical protein
MPSLDVKEFSILLLSLGEKHPEIGTVRKRTMATNVICFNIFTI